MRISLAGILVLLVAVFGMILTALVINDLIVAEYISQQFRNAVGQ